MSAYTIIFLLKKKIPRDIVHRVNGLNIFQVKWIEPIYKEKKKNVIVHPLSSIPGVFRRFCIFSVKEKRILHFKNR